MLFIGRNHYFIQMLPASSFLFFFFSFSSLFFLGGGGGGNRTVSYKHFWFILSDDSTESDKDVVERSSESQQVSDVAVLFWG